MSFSVRPGATALNRGVETGLRGPAGAADAVDLVRAFDDPVRFDPVVPVGEAMAAVLLEPPEIPNREIP